MSFDVKGSLISNPRIFWVIVKVVFFSSYWSFFLVPLWRSLLRCVWAFKWKSYQNMFHIWLGQDDWASKVICKVDLSSGTLFEPEIFVSSAMWNPKPMALGTSLTLESLYETKKWVKIVYHSQYLKDIILTRLDLTNNITKVKAQVYVNLCNMV